MRVMIVMGSQDLYVMWKTLKTIKILIRMLYLIFSPLMLVKMLLMVKVRNLFWKDVISQITINPLQFMLKFQNTKSKSFM